MEDIPANLGYITNDPNNKEIKNYSKVPENCALGVINVDATDGNSLNNVKTIAADVRVSISHFCASCKPGYRPTFLSTTFNHIPTKCTLIENCIGKDWFNSCSKCN
jgi:hypothetical protein